MTVNLDPSVGVVGNVTAEALEWFTVLIALPSVART